MVREAATDDGSRSNRCVGNQAHENGGEGGARTHIAEGARFTVWGANQLLNLPPISPALECKECPENEQQSRVEIFYAGKENMPA